MGLFLNGRQHPEMFMNKESIHEPNQDCYTYDPLTEWKTGQRMIDEEMRGNIQQLAVELSKERLKQKDRWLSVSYRLEELREQQYEEAAFEENVIERLVKLEEQNQLLHESFFSKQAEQQELIRQIETIHHSNQELTISLQHTQKLHDVLLVRMEEQRKDQQRVAEVLEKQTAAQIEMTSRLDRQEGMLDKLARQMDHLRSIIYERSHDLAEKIEKGYKITTLYAAKLKRSPIKHSDESTR
ncbi:hypothetical protein NCCP2222_17620 [Sporosarcina sp. NCCP-2222]|uniref:hypothetical protein n=1 Tax=Sporosarcina sp. NCCP-2222 TaxID=2935073 RepID=UPI00208C561A|nr:hypothetical protein [Sporosarcina sp. NCCP-2222]GKV55815.1 hypothetical protein NCCP2222_17620 [Sporosarcina sp. NCCP-2222]